MSNLKQRVLSAVRELQAGGSQSVSRSALQNRPDLLQGLSGKTPKNTISAAVTALVKSGDLRVVQQKPQAFVLAVSGDSCPPCPPSSSVAKPAGQRKVSKKAAAGTRKASKKAAGGTRKASKKAAAGKRKASKKAAAGKRKPSKKAAGSQKASTKFRPGYHSQAQVQEFESALEQGVVRAPPSLMLMNLDKIADVAAEMKTLTAKAPAAGRKRRASKKAASRAPSAKRQKRGHKSAHSFALYIHRILRAENEMSIGRRAMHVMNSFAVDALRRVIQSAVNLALDQKRKTLTAPDVLAAAQLEMSGELARMAVSFASQAVRNFGQSRSGQRGAPVSVTQRAGLLMSVPRVERVIRAHAVNMRVGQTASVAAAAVLESLVAEVLDLAVKAAVATKKNRVAPRHIALAVHMDEELSALFGARAIAAGGVLPHVHAALLSKKQQKKQEADRASLMA